MRKRKVILSYWVILQWQLLIQIYRTLDEKKDNEFEWGISTLPVGAENSNIANGISMNEIFSIPSNNRETGGAWEFIKYISGNDYALLLPQSTVTDDDNTNL